MKLFKEYFKFGHVYVFLIVFYSGDGKDHFSLDLILVYVLNHCLVVIPVPVATFPVPVAGTEALDHTTPNWSIHIWQHANFVDFHFEYPLHVNTKSHNVCIQLHSLFS